MTGGGRYEEETRRLRMEIEALGVIVIVAHGKKGDAFEIQMPPEIISLIPSVLREMADKIEADLVKLTTGNKG